MRSLTALRNYSLLILFVILTGGVLLQPGNREAERIPPVQTAGIAP